MAESLLSGVNEVLKKMGTIAGDAGELSSLTDSPRQRYIDAAVQAWNEAIDELYTTASVPQPKVLAENTIVLATGDRDYALQGDLVRLHFPLLDETNGRYIVEYPGGYMALVESQPQPANFTGLPIAAAIRPTDSQLYLDRIPTATENGLTYKYRYEKDLSLSLAADTMPFTDAVFRSMVPAVAELTKRNVRQTFDAGIFTVSLGRAARQVVERPQRQSWR